MESQESERLNLDFKQKARKDEEKSGEDQSTNDGMTQKYRETAEEIFGSVMSSIHGEVENELRQQFMDRKTEEQMPGFGKVYSRLRNLEDHWEAAKQGKSHQRIDEGDLESLHVIIKEVELGIKLELKANCYLSMVLEELRETNLEPEDISDFGSEEDEGKQFVGDYIHEASQEAERLEIENSIRERNSQVASEVNKMIEGEEENLKEEIRQEEQLVMKYEKFLKFLKGLEKELEAIEEAKEDEEIKELDQVQKRLRVCIGHTKVTINERSHIHDRIQTAEGVKETISKVFYGGLLR